MAKGKPGSIVEPENKTLLSEHPLLLSTPLPLSVRGLTLPETSAQELESEHFQNPDQYLMCIPHRVSQTYRLHPEHKVFLPK
eukprot:c25941_g1_i5 orf=3-245(-)